MPKTWRGTWHATALLPRGEEFQAGQKTEFLGWLHLHSPLPAGECKTRQMQTGNPILT